MSEIFYNAKNFNISNGFVRNPDRYYLEEWFHQLPTMESPVSVTQATNLTTAVTSNNKNTIITTESTSSNVTASEWIEFTFTNQFITANSVIYVHVQDSTDNTSSSEKLLFQINNVSVGSCSIRCINPSASAATAQIYKLFVAIDPQVPSNLNFCIADSTGASATSKASDISVSYSSERSGINLVTGGSDNDSVVLLPRTNTSQELGNNSNSSAWSGILWGTENQLEWECAISIADISNLAFWAGLKDTKTPVIATDANQAYFVFDSGSDNVTNASLTDTSYLHFVHSISGTDYISQLPITIAAGTSSVESIYKLRITIDSSRFLRICVNGKQYNITTTSGSTGGTAVTTGTSPSTALTDNTDFKPYIGVQSTTGAADTLTVYYQKISRVLFE